MIILSILLLIVGFVALIKGADLFVDGSAGLAKNFHVPELIIGLTIVALGTSAPELAVSTSAALQGSNEIALSNVIGSNIFNLLVVLGGCAVFHPVPVDRGVMKRDFPVAIGSSLLVLLMTGGLPAVFRAADVNAAAGSAGRLLGALLLTGFVIYIVYLILDAKKHPQASDESIAARPVWKCLLLIAVGLGLIVLGGQLVVNSAKDIARAAGMTETLIGLTIIAVGTSLPELVTSLVAAKKGETELAVGNAVGSCIFNMMFILGISTLLHPITVNVASIIDLLILLAVCVLTAVFAASDSRINRAEGIIMVLLYVADVVYAILR